MIEIGGAVDQKTRTYPAWMEDVRDGDVITLPNARDAAEAVTVVTVSQLSVDDVVFDGQAVRLFRFIGTHEDGRQKHMSYGGAYPVWIKR